MGPKWLRYCWWKKSCTTWHVQSPVNNGRFSISTGAGFLPWTVWLSRQPGFLLFHCSSCCSSCDAWTPSGLEYRNCFLAKWIGWRPFRYSWTTFLFGMFFFYKKKLAGDDFTPFWESTVPNFCVQKTAWQEQTPWQIIRAFFEKLATLGCPRKLVTG